jgi:enamine deaminase RidA (YjgF/YER057c/UK114 family)
VSHLGEIVGKGRPREQIDMVLESINGALWLSNPTGNPVVVKLNVAAATLDVANEVHRTLAGIYSGRDKPAVSYVVGKLRRPEALVAIDAVAFSPKTPTRGVVTVDPKKPPVVSVLGPGPKVYVSGQAEKGTDIADMTKRTMESLEMTLKHLGLGWNDVVQVKSFIGPMGAVPDAEREIVSFFKDNSPVPPLVFVEWTTEPAIEIELIAGSPKSSGPIGDTIEFITPPGMQASPVFSRVARLAAGPTIFTSGLYGNSHGNGDAETREIFGQLGNLLEKTGSDFRHLAKATYYVSTNEASLKLGTIRPEFYDPQRPPAASKAPVTGTGREGRTINLDMIAVPRPNPK